MQIYIHETIIVTIIFMINVFKLYDAFINHKNTDFLV